MQHNIPNPEHFMPNQDPVRHTAGIYYSQAALDSEHLVLPTEVSSIRAEGVMPHPEVSRAIGMAAIPEGSKGEQITKLVYNGMTSAEYAARHEAWLQQFAYIQDVMNQIESAGVNDDDDEDDNNELAHAGARKKAKARRKP